MLYCCHRINTIAELSKINHSYGVEIDLRDTPDGSICLVHDPFFEFGSQLPENFEIFLQSYRHSFLILNIKSEGIEYKVLEFLEKYKIRDYFFLDSSFPMIHRLSSKGVQNIAVRFSEYESIETALSMAAAANGCIKWVWVDCFTKNPLTRAIYDKIKAAGLKICFVSPELQGYGPEKLAEYRDFFKKEGIELDMVCTKSHNIKHWRRTRPVQIVIPMSGSGKRFKDAGYTAPKPLIEVDGHPMIEHVVNLFSDEPIVKFVCNQRHLDDASIQMRETLHRICPWGSIHQVPDEGRQGPVHAVASMQEDQIDDNLEVIVSYCDYGTYWNYDDFLKDTRERDADGAIACYRGFHPHMLGTDNYAFLRETKQDSRWMAEIREKQPFTEDRMSEYASNGTYYFKTGSIMKQFFKELMSSGERVNGEYYVSMVYNFMVEKNLRVSIYEIQNMLQWGTPYDLEVYLDWSKYFRNIANPPRSTFIDRLGTTLILPMAGAGSRFSKKGYELPKPLIDVDGQPMIIRAVDCLPTTTNKIFICLDEHIHKYELDKVIQSKFEYKTQWGRACPGRDGDDVGRSDTWRHPKVFGIEGITKGQACTCEIGIKKGGVTGDTPILISACDNGVVYNVEAYQSLVDDPTIDVIVWCFRNNPTSRNNPNMYAWVETGADDCATRVSCKKFDPTRHNIKTSPVIIGTMFFRKARYFTEGLEANYRENIRSNGEFYVDDVLNQCIAAGLCVKVFEVENYICWGTPDDYETYNYWRGFFDKYRSI